MLKEKFSVIPLTFDDFCVQYHRINEINYLSLSIRGFVPLSFTGWQGILFGPVPSLWFGVIYVVSH